MDGMSSVLRQVLDDPSKYVTDPSQLINLGLKFVSTEVLDGLIDKMMEATKDAMTSGEDDKSVLDPVTIPDITIPYSLDKMTGACAPMLKDKHGALGEILAALCACVAKNMNVEGDLFLKNGILQGLSNILRTSPTKLEVANGVANVGVALGVQDIEAPFETSASIASPDFKPEVKALVKRVGINFGVQVPLDGSTSTTGTFNFDPPLEELPVDVDIKLDELGEIEEEVKSLIIDPVKRKLIEILRGELQEKLKEKVSKFIPGISALT